MNINADIIEMTPESFCPTFGGRIKGQSQLTIA